MSELIAVPIGNARVTADDEVVVASPYDGAEIGRVPSCGAAHVDRAVAAAKARLAEPLPAHERAAILDRAAILLAERQEDFARTIAQEAAKPIRTARIEAGRAVDTFRFSAVEARRLSTPAPLHARPGAAATTSSASAASPLPPTTTTGPSSAAARAG